MCMCMVQYVYRYLTNELAASHYAKRLVMLDFMQGDADHHLARFAATAVV